MAEGEVFDYGVEFLSALVDAEFLLFDEVDKSLYDLFVPSDPVDEVPALEEAENLVHVELEELDLIEV